MERFISWNSALACYLLLRIQDTGGDDLTATVTGGDVLKVARDNPVVVSTKYRTRFCTPSLDSGAQHDASD